MGMFNRRTPRPAPQPSRPTFRPSDTSARLREAERRIDDWVEKQQVLNSSSRSLLDEPVAALKARWLEEVAEEHDAYLGGLGDRRAKAVTERRNRQDALADAEKDVAAKGLLYRAACKPLGVPVLPDPAAPAARGSTTPMNYDEDPGLALGVPFSERLPWLFVPGAIGADLAAFYSVIARLFNGSTFLIIVGTIGFTAAAVGIAHAFGVALKRRKLRHPRRSAGLLWSSAAAWVGLGAMAFAARLFIEPVVSGSPGRPLLLAATFAALYVVSGVLAIGAAYNAYNPDAWALRRAAKNLKQARADAAAARAACTAVEEEVGQLDEELQRAPARLDTAVKKAEADERTARSHARLAILARIKDPGAASAFTS